MSTDLYIPSKVSLELINWSFLKPYGIELAVLRLDKTDKTISGNKWFKLHYHVQQALSENKYGLISVGGPHSNHLHALAAAGIQLKMPIVALIRGNIRDTPTVRDLQDMGVSIHWLSYGDFRARYQAEFWNYWLGKYNNFYAVPEGGTGILGAKGCCIIPEFIDSQLPKIGWSDYDKLYVAVGTGSTLAGIIWGDKGRHQLIGCLATPLKYGVPKQVAQLLIDIGCNYNNYQLLEASRKGFGQFDTELLEFIREVEQQTTVLLDPVYTAKALLRFCQQVKKSETKKGSRVILVHTGGLQGRRVALASD